MWHDMQAGALASRQARGRLSRPGVDPARGRPSPRPPRLTDRSVGRVSSSHTTFRRNEMAGNGEVRWPRGSDRRGGAHPGRPRSRGEGLLQGRHPSNLLAKTYTELIERSGIDAAEVEDVVAGCVQQFGEQAFNIGRNAWLEAGLPIETPATTLDRQCGSGQQAVNFAAALIASGVHDVVDRRRGRAHGPHLLRRRDRGPAGARVRLQPRADGALQPRPAGDLGRDDRRQVGDPALRARRDRPALAPARRQGDRGGPLRPRDRADPGQRRHLHHRPGDPPRLQPRGAGRS